MIITCFSSCYCNLAIFLHFLDFITSMLSVATCNFKIYRCELCVCLCISVCFVHAYTVYIHVCAQASLENDPLVLVTSIRLHF